MRITLNERQKRYALAHWVNDEDEKYECFHQVPGIRSFDNDTLVQQEFIAESDVDWIRPGCVFIFCNDCVSFVIDTNEVENKQWYDEMMTLEETEETRKLREEWGIAQDEFVAMLFVADAPELHKCGARVNELATKLRELYCL